MLLFLSLEKSRTSLTKNGPFVIILNLAVAGQWPSSPGHNTSFPFVFEGNCVKVFCEVNCVAATG